MIDAKKIETIELLLRGLKPARPSILKLCDDNFCWLQFYMLRFLKIDSLIFVVEHEQKQICKKLPIAYDNMPIYFYKDDAHIIQLVKEKLDVYVEKNCQQSK